MTTKQPATADLPAAARPGSAAWRNGLLGALLFLGVLLLAGRELHGLPGALQALTRVRPLPAGLALIAIAASFVAAAGSYAALSPRPIAFRKILAVQLAAGFVNRLLPAGLGGMGLFALLYRREGASGAAASAAAASNNLLGFIGNGVLVAAVLLLRPDYISQPHAPRLDGWLWIVLLAAAAAAIAALLFRRGRFAEAVRSFGTALAGLTRAPHKVAQALACNLLVTSLMAAALSLSVAAAQASLSWAAALLVLSLGTLVGAALPTPGGVGGVEAGFLAGLLAFGVPGAPVVAAVLLYRALSYWLPIIPGAVTLRLAVRAKLV